MTEYVLPRQGAEELERERLELVAAYYDPLTIRQLDAIGEVDFGTVQVSPSSTVWARTWAAFTDAVLAAGWDPRYGTRLRSDLGAAGLVEVESEHFGRIVKGGSPNARLLGLTLERLRG